MIYRGKKIEDTAFISKSQVIEKEEGACENYLSFSPGDLEELSNELEMKKKELTDLEINFKDITLEIEAEGKRHYEYSSDEEAYHIIKITWKQEESSEDKEERIKSSKKRIDEQIEEEAKEEERKKDFNEKILASAIDIVKKAGGKITF